MTNKAHPQPAEDAQDWLETDDETAMRAAIFSRKKKRAEIVLPIPEWNMKVLVRSMSGTQQYEYEAATARYASMEDRSALYKHLAFLSVQMCCLHPKTQQPVFKPNDQGTFLDEEDGAVIERLSSIALRISHMDQESRVQARKNLNVVLRSTDTSSLQND